MAGVPPWPAMFPPGMLFQVRDRRMVPCVCFSQALISQFLTHIHPFRASAVLQPGVMIPQVAMPQALAFNVRQCGKPLF